MVRARVGQCRVALHGWHYVIEAGEVNVFDLKAGGFVPASLAEHSGTGPYASGDDASDGSYSFNEIDPSRAPGSSFCRSSLTVAGNDSG